MTRSMKCDYRQLQIASTIYTPNESKLLPNHKKTSFTFNSKRNQNIQYTVDKWTETLPFFPYFDALMNPILLL